MKESAESSISVSLDESGDKPFMNDLQNRLRKERGAADGAVIVVDLGPLQVDVKTATRVPPHNDVSDVWNRDDKQKVIIFGCISATWSLADQFFGIPTNFFFFIILLGFVPTPRIHLKFSHPASWR